MLHKVMSLVSKLLSQLKMAKDSSSPFKNVGKTSNPLKIDISITASTNYAGDTVGSFRAQRQSFFSILASASVG